MNTPTTETPPGPPGFLHRLFAPVDIASLVFFRIAFGALLAFEVVRYTVLGRVAEYWIKPKFYFTYDFFGWVQPWSEAGMYIHWVGLGVLAVLIMLGWWYRVVMALFCAGWTYVFLLDESKYLNHFYFIALVSFLMIFVPAHRAFSVDAWRQPSLRSNTVPAWSLWIIAAQMGVVYFHGGLAKLNSDWLSGEPMRFWLAGRDDFVAVGRLFAQEWTTYAFSYGGLLLDLTVVPLLLWRKTRWFAFIWATSFHLLNKWMLGVGIFPWFSIAATALFLPPHWPRPILRRLAAGLKLKIRSSGLAAGPPVAEPSAPAPIRFGGRERAILAGLAIYMAIQLLVPLRKHLYPGAVNWTELGHNFSWHMKLRDKTGQAEFIVIEPVTQQTWNVALRDYLTRRQIAKMTIRPSMILQFSHHLRSEWAKQGHENVVVRARVICTLNGRRPQNLIDPNVNLAAITSSSKPDSWIVPLKEPLPPPEISRRQAHRLVLEDEPDNDFDVDDLGKLPREEGD